MRPTLVLCGSLLLPFACGPDKGDDSDATATTGDAPTTGGAVPTTGGEATTASTATDPDPTGTPDACAPFADTEPSPGVTVTLRNDRDTPVFLNHVNFCGEVPLFAMTDADAAPVTWMHGMCTFTCGQAIAGVCGCPAFCPEDAVMMIAPGGRHTLVWSGALYGEAALPQECADDSCGPQCLVQRQAAAGVYTLRAVGATSATSCADPDVCTCTPNPEGWCDVPAASVGPEPVEATAEFDYPLMTAVEVVFGP